MSPTCVDSTPVIASCSAAEASALLSGSLDDALSPAERAQLLSFSSPKRRQDWLSGRLAAKRAVGRWLGRLGAALPEPTIEIVNDDDGQPSARLPAHIPRTHLSISHCRAGGIAAVHNRPVGIDWEPVAARDADVLSWFIHDSERAQARGADEQTSLWSIKEAALKLLGAGLSGGPADVRWIGGRLQFHGAAKRLWEAAARPEIAVEARVETQPGEERIAVALAYCP